MDILITGSGGLLGQRLANKFSQTNLEIKGTDIEEIDLSDSERTVRWLEEWDPETIIHCAAMTGVDDCELDKGKAVSANIAATHNLVNFCKKRNSKLVFISTDYIFPQNHPTGGLWKEDDTPGPVDFYGMTKFIGEGFVKTLDRYLICRTSILYGVAKNVRLNFGLWTVKAVLNKEKIKIAADQYVTPTLVNDLVNQIYSLIMKNETGVFNTVGKTRVSRYEFLKEVAKEFGVQLEEDNIEKVNTEDLKQPAKRPLRGGLSTKKIESIGIKVMSLPEQLKIFKEEYFKYH